MTFPPFLSFYVWSPILQSWDMATLQPMSQLSWEFIWPEFINIYIGFCHLSIQREQSLPVAIKTRNLDDTSEKKYVSVNSQRATCANIRKMPQNMCPFLPKLPQTMIKFLCVPIYLCVVAKSSKWVICMGWVKIHSTGTSLVVQWVRLWAPISRSLGSIPG